LSKRIKLVLAVVAVTATTMVAGAAAAGAVEDTDTTNAKRHPFAVGSGTDEPGEQFSFSAHEGPNGPSGYAKIEFPASASYPQGFQVQGHVTCFDVVAPNTVRFGIEIEKSSGSVPAGYNGFTFYVEDNGKRNSQSPDIIGTGFSPEAPTVCPQQFGTTPVTKGDIRVHTVQ
jgi:hypothetical protein